MGCCGSKKSDRDNEGLESVVHEEAARIACVMSVTEFHSSEVSEDVLDGRQDRHWDDNQFFQMFFEAIDKKPRFKGILKRWEKASKRANLKNENENWTMVWNKHIGYINTLEEIEGLIRNGEKGLPVADLRELATKVVKRRENEYWNARSEGRADTRHSVALEHWKNLESALQAKK